MLDAVDDDELDAASGRRQLQSELFLQWPDEFAFTDTASNVTAGDWARAASPATNARNIRMTLGR
jgi:hypothetical protein